MVLDQSRSSKPRPISAEVGGGKVGIEAGGLGLFFADELWEDDFPFNDPIDRNPFRRFPEPVVLGERSSFGDCICGLSLYVLLETALGAWGEVGKFWSIHGRRITAPGLL